QGEIDAADAEAEGEEADAEAEGHGYRDGDPDAGPGTDAEMHVKRGRRIAAEADIERMAEAELAREAHHHVPGLAGIGEVENDDENGEDVGVDQQRRDQHRGHEQAEQDQRALRHAIDKTGDHALRPSRPCGRKSSTRISSATANMLFAEGAKNRPDIASDRPIRMPPSSAPGIEPSPPTMTMTKACRVKAGPMLGVVSTSSTIMAPAAPTQAEPMPKVRA